jgi:hypothetical protein
MTLTRILPHELRASLLIALGTGLLITPVWLLLSPAAIVLGLLAGVLSVGMGIAGTAAGGRGTIPLGAHKAYDRVLALGLLLAALAFGAAGEQEAMAVFAAAGFALLLIGTNTRYSAPSH